MIISILGTAGAVFNKENCYAKRDQDGNLLARYAQYDSSLFDIESKSYKNSTHFLLNNFDQKFIFIGTKCAIKFQKDILAEEMQEKEIRYEEIQDNNLDDIFEKIYNLMEDQDNIILDITHGFRHQPIMAIFASTLSQFLERKKLDIIFAKEVKQFEEYKYIYLDEYIEITQISLLLIGFIRTLNFIPIKKMKLLNNKIFEDFSKSLLSNDLKGVEEDYKKLKRELNLLLNNSDLKHLFNLFIQVKKELKIFDKFDTIKPYEKYLALTKLTTKKNYLAIALAYIFESFREYCSYKFHPIIKNLNFRNNYDLNTSVIDTIANFKRNKRDNRIQQKYQKIYKNNKPNFKRVSTVYEEVRRLRNDLAHINQTKDFDDIKLTINQIIFKIEVIYKDDPLKNIKI